MATTESRTNSSPGQKYVDFDEFIDYQVRKTRSGIRSTDLLTSLVVLALGVTSYLLAFVVIDHWVVAGGIGYWPRLVALTLVTLFIVGWTGWKLVIPYLRRVSALFAAREIEHAQPDLKSSLLTLIDLKRAGRAVPPHIVAAMEKRAARKLSAADIEQAVDRRLLMRLSYALLAVVAVMCAYTVFSPKSISNSVLRALMPASSRSVSTRTRIEAVDPGDAEVLARSQLQVTVDLAGEIPETATLLYSSADRSFVDEPITLRDTGEGLHRFRGVLAGPNGRGLLQNLTYHIVAGDAESREYQVTVKQAPYATVTEVLLDYPDYMRLDDKTQPGGDIDAWEGTVVTLRAETNMPVASGAIERSTNDDASLGTDSLPMRLIDDTHLEVTWRLEFDEGVPYRFYRIDVRTEAGAGDPRPRFYSVNIRRDIPPEVRILHPTGDVELPANGVLPVAYEALDPDFMLRYVRMYFEQPGEAPDKFAHRTRRLFEAPPERSSARGIEDVRLSDFDLKAGDVLSLWLEARDNQAPLGAEDGNATRTSRINITILDPVSPEEARQLLEEQREQLQQDLQESQQQDAEAGGEQTAEATGEQESGSDTEGTAGEASETTEGESGEPGEETSGDGQSQGDEGTAAQRSDGTGGDEQTPDAEAASEPGQEAGEGSEAEQPGAEPSADEEQSGEGSEASESAEAEDNEALRRLIDEYNALEEAQRQREQDQQEAAEDSREGEPDQPGEQPQSDDADGQGGESPSGSESESQTPSAGPNQPSGDETGTGQSPGESETASEGGGEERPADDPTADARSGDVENGTETPTDEEGPAQPQRATGDEEGTARPETDPNAEPTPAREPIEREGGDPATRPTEQPSDEQGEGMPQDTGGGERPEGAQPAPDTDAEPSDSPGDRGSSQSGMPEADRPPARSDQQPSGPDQSDPAPGAREGQRSEQPASGEQGSGQQASEGTQGGSQQGPGDATSSPGSQSDAAGQPGGQPGDRSGEGSTSQAGGNQPGGEGMSDQSTQEGQGGGESGSQEGAGEGGGEGSQGGGEGGQGGGEGSQGEGGQGGGAEGGGQGGEEGGGGGGGEGSQSQGGQAGTTQGGGTDSRSGGGGTGGSGGQAPNGSGGGADSGADSRPLDPNLEDKRRASELVLERLKDQLERGEAPEELLDDLGWTEEKLRDFMGRLEQRLADTGEDTSPEAEARRRQFETILEGIDYASEGQQRDAEAGPRQSAEGFGSQRRAVPPEFRDQQEVYRRRLSRQTRGE